MEINGGDKHQLTVCLYEMMGTAFLLMTVNWGAANGGKNPMQQSTAVAYSFGTFVSFLSVGCGCNFNPAVTTAVYIYEGNLNAGTNFPFYLKTIASQIIGAIIGVTLVGTTADFTLQGKSNGFAVLAPPEPYHSWRIIFPEFLGSFIFVSFVLSVKYHQPDSSNLLKCFFVGLALYGVINAIGSVSGGCINPSVGLVQSIFQSVMEKRYKEINPIDSSTFKEELLNTVAGNAGLYFFSTLFGGIFAGFFQRWSGHFGQELAGDLPEQQDNVSENADDGSEAGKYAPTNMDSVRPNEAAVNGRSTMN